MPGVLINTNETIYNNEIGFLGASLVPTTAGTSQAITNLFAVVPNFDTVASPHYVTIALDAGNSNFEIVRLTAYTAGSRNGTITRGVEDGGTYWPPSAHTIGTSTWQTVPTVASFASLNTQITTAAANLASEITRATTAEGLKLAIANNLNDLANKVTALTNLIGTGATNQVLQWNGTSWAPATLGSFPPSGTAGGDLSGTYPNPTVARIQGIAVSNTAPTLGQTLRYDGTQWVPVPLVPTGTVVSWLGQSGGTIPSGWVVAKGGTLPVGGANAALFALLGTAFGGDGVTTFGLPDLRGRVQIGYIDNSVFGYTNVASGATMGSSSILTGNLPNLAHTHGINLPLTLSGGALGITIQVSATGAFQFLDTAGPGQAESNTTAGVNVVGNTASALTGSATSYSQPAFAIVPLIKL